MDTHTEGWQAVTSSKHTHTHSLSLMFSDVALPQFPLIFCHSSSLHPRSVPTSPRQPGDCTDAIPEAVSLIPKLTVIRVILTGSPVNNSAITSSVSTLHHQAADCTISVYSHFSQSNQDLAAVVLLQSVLKVLHLLCLLPLLSLLLLFSLLLYLHLLFLSS